MYRGGGGLSDARVPFAACLAAFGTPATVTIPGGDPVATSVIWIPVANENQPFGAEFAHRAPIRMLAIPTADVPSASRGTAIVAAEMTGGTAVGWRVDAPALEQVDVEHQRVIVVRDSSLDP